MKKFLSILFSALIAVSCLALAGCGESNAKLKLGLGVVSGYGESKNADGDTKGSAVVSNTTAAVLVDKDGKIVKCAVDTVDAKVEFSSKGELTAAADYKTKGELGTDYGMSKFGMVEWDVQVDNFCKLVEGKTLDEVKAFVANDGKGNTDVINAGCTIIISDFVKAIEKAVNNAAESNATAKDTLSLAFITKQEKASNASSDKSGSVDVTSSISAAALNADKKVSALKSDSVSASIKFSLAGALETDKTKAPSSKRELGKNYGMSAYGTDLNGDSVVKEWFEQADVLDAACIGKTADEIGALVVNGYGVDSLKTAGCTIAISDMVAAIVKAAK